MLRFLILLVFATLPIASHAEGSSEPLDETQVRSKVAEALQGRHTDQSADWWHGLGSGAPRVIASMYESEPRTHRKLRLLGALGYYDDAGGVALLKREAQTTKNSVVRQTAIRALTQSQGMKQ